MIPPRRTLPLAIFTAALFFCASKASMHTMENQQPATLPEIPAGHEVATLAAGCYWCVEAVYQRLDGVHSVVSGFTGGHVAHPTYENVCSGTTGHAESVRIVYNPQKISYTQILDWFWRLHDPTSLNRQGADVGTHYRSAIFYHNDAQKQQATASRAKAQTTFPSPIVTEITKATNFYPTKLSHQDYYRTVGNRNPYCQRVITPKLKKLGLNQTPSSKLKTQHSKLPQSPAGHQPE